MDFSPETKSVWWEKILAETPGVFRTSELLKKCLVEPGARGACHVLAHTPRLVELNHDVARSHISCFPESKPCLPETTCLVHKEASAVNTIKNMTWHLLFVRIHCWDIPWIRFFSCIKCSVELGSWLSYSGALCISIRAWIQIPSVHIKARNSGT